MCFSSQVMDKKVAFWQKSIKFCILILKIRRFQIHFLSSFFPNLFSLLRGGQHGLDALHPAVNFAQKLANHLLHLYAKLIKFQFFYKFPNLCHFLLLRVRDWRVVMPLKCVNFIFLKFPRI